jgi:NAD(P)-dependent dehydrogenase (short-subunit alcohol dehydrogenase family)
VAISSEPRVAVVTGATSGIGRALAEAIAAAGLTVDLVARDSTRGEAARRSIAAQAGDDRVIVSQGDLSSLASVRALARAIGERHRAVDILIHCAAVYTPRRSVTDDRIEMMLATNVLAPFLLTNLLLDRLGAAGSARVLVLSAPSTVRLDFDDLGAERRFRSLTQFGATKAADLLFTFELARRLEGSGITANAVHPGLVRTNLMRGAPAPLRWATRLVSAPPERAAAAMAPLALSPEYAGLSGRFFKGGRAVEAPPYTRDPEVARRLWDTSIALTGLSEGAAS